LHACRAGNPDAVTVIGGVHQQRLLKHLYY
jgi:hypothetical protein